MHKKKESIPDHPQQTATWLFKSGIKPYNRLLPSVPYICAEINKKALNRLKMAVKTNLVHDKQFN